MSASLDGQAIAIGCRGHQNDRKMIEITRTNDGFLLLVQAQPGARRNGVTGIHNGRLKVALTQAQAIGMANETLIQRLADALQLKRSQVRLHAGETSRAKIFLISGVAAEQLQVKVDAALGDS
jgi:uncharacterized protein (TIGR00251 family)